MTENNSEQCIKNEDEMKCSPSEKIVTLNMLVFGVLPKNQPNSDELQVFVNRPEGKGEWLLPGKILSFGKSSETDNGKGDDNGTLSDVMRKALKGKWDLGNNVYGKTSFITTRYSIKPNPDLVSLLDTVSVLESDNDEEIEIHPYMTLVSIREKNLFPSDVHPNFARWMPLSKLIKIQDDDFVSGEEGLAKNHFEILKSGLLQLFQEVMNQRIGGSKDVANKEDWDKYVDEEVVKKYEHGVGVDQLIELDDYYMLPSEFEYSDLVHINYAVYRSLGVPMGKPYFKKLINDVIRKEDGGKCRFVANRYKSYKYKYRYKHARTNIATDMVVFGVLPDINELCVFVRINDEGNWSLPGRYMHCGRSSENEKVDDGDNWTLEVTIRKALTRTWEKEESVKIREKNSPIRNRSGMNNGIKPEKTDIVYVIKPNIDLICQLEAMSALNRDDRENRRVVSIPYMTLVNVKEDVPNDLKNYAQWMPVSRLIKIKEDYAPGEVKLAHDHSIILKNGIMRLFQEVRTRPIGGGVGVAHDDDIIKKYKDKDDRSNSEDYYMLPFEFELQHLINIYNAIMQTMGVSVERSNLRKLLLERGVIKESKNENLSKKGWGSYQFVTEKYKEYKEHLNFGFNPKSKD